MGCTYAAYAVIGVYLNASEIVHEEQVPAFEHSYPKHYKVDPVSGRDLWRTQKSCILDPGSDDLSGISIDGLKLINDGRYPYQNFYFGLVVENSSYDTQTKPEIINSLDEIKARVKKALKPFDLWSESKFGLWAVQYVSC